jgi:hypothetical protein
MYSKSPYLDKTNEAITGLSKVIEKRKELFEKSSPEDKEEKEEEKEIEEQPKKARKPKTDVSYKLPIIVGSVGLIIIIIFFLFLFVL